MFLRSRKTATWSGGEESGWSRAASIGDKLYLIGPRPGESAITIHRRDTYLCRNRASSFARRSNTLSIVYCVRAKSPYGETADAVPFCICSGGGSRCGGIVLACEIRSSALNFRLVTEARSKQRYLFHFAQLYGAHSCICKSPVDYTRAMIGDRDA